LPPLVQIRGVLLNFEFALLKRLSLGNC